MCYLPPTLLRIWGNSLLGNWNRFEGNLSFSPQTPDPDDNCRLSWLYGNEVQGLQALLYAKDVQHVGVSTCVYVCLHVCETQLAVGMEVAADCQSVKSGRTYCQQLLSSADNSIYIGVYVCVYKRVYMPANTGTHIQIQRQSQIQTGTCKLRQCALSSLKV